MHQEGRLSKDAFDKAAAFLRNESRSLEAARFDCIFNKADVSKTLYELSKFQNPDGGFGHALEPDLRTPESSALCTSIAFQIMRDHGVSPNHEMIQSAVCYLIDTFDKEELHWRIIPKSAEDAPHAPHWKQSGREAGVRSFSLNPTAEILGYLIDYSDTDFTDEIFTHVIQTIRSSESIEMHDLLCCLRLLESETLSVAKRADLQTELSSHINSAVELDSGKWAEYCLRPLQVASKPDSPFYDSMEKAVSDNLNYEIASQESDGAWHPTWSWSGHYPNDWELAKQEWSGVLTLEKLKLLNAFGRI